MYCDVCDMRIPIFSYHEQYGNYYLCGECNSALSDDITRMIKEYEKSKPKFNFIKRLTLSDVEVIAYSSFREKYDHKTKKEAEEQKQLTKRNKAIKAIKAIKQR